MVCLRKLALLALLVAPSAARADHPLNPVNLQQRNSDGTSLCTGCTANSTTVQLTAASQSPTCTGSCVYYLDLEVRATTASFTGSPTNSSSPCMSKPSCVQQTYPWTSVTVSGGVAYKWQVRERTTSGVSAWVQYNAGGTAFVGSGGPPTFGAFSVGPTVSRSGTTVTASTSGTSDPDGSSIRLVACRSPGASSGGCTGSSVCIAGIGCSNTWCASGWVGSNPSCSFSAGSDTATYTVYGYVFDSPGSGSTANPRTASLSFDNSPPAMTASLSGTPGLAGWFRSPVTVTLSCSDVGAAGCSTRYYCTDTADTCAPTTVYSGSFTVSAEGTTYVRYYAVDGVGNSGSPASTTVRVDSQAPSAPGVPGATPNPNAGLFSVDWSAATDASSGVATYQVERSADGGGTWTAVTTTSGTTVAESRPEGQYLHRVRAVDVAGNVGPYATMTDPVVVETTPARLAFATPPQTTVAGQASQPITVQVQTQAGFAVPARTDIAATLVTTASGTGQFAPPTSTAFALGPAPLIIPAGQSEASFLYRDTLAGNLTLSVSAPSFAGASLAHTVQAALPAGLALTGVPARLRAGDSSPPLTVEVRDAFANRSPVAADTAVALATSSADAAFERVPLGPFDGSVVSVTVLAGAASAPFYYLDRVAGQPTLEASEAVLGKASAGLTVEGAAPHAVRLSAPRGTSAPVGTWIDVQAALVDPYGNDAPGSNAVLLAATPGSRLRTTPVSTDPGTGKAQTAVVGGSPGAVQVSVVSTLPALSGASAPLTVMFTAGTATRVAVTASSDQALACGCIDLGLQVIDATGQPAAGAYPLELTLVGPASMSARIRSTSLATGADVVAASGWTDDAGAASARVCSRASESVAAEVKSPSFPGGSPATRTLTFLPGALSRARSDFGASGNVIQAGTGVLTLTVVPRDECGALLGPGHAVVVLADLPEAVVGQSQDGGDGTYRAELRVPLCPRRPEDPPAVLRLTASVDGAVLSDGEGRPRSIDVTVQCRPLSPALTGVSLRGADAGPACHAPSRGPAAPWAAEVLVTPRDADGNAFAGTWEVSVEGAQAPDLYEETDAQPGGDSALLRIASDRCRKEPRSVRILVNGVLVGAPVPITFTCLPVNAASGASRVAAVPSDIALGGNLAASLAAADTCGNPAFGRPATLNEAAGILSFAQGGGATDERGEFATRATGRAGGTTTVMAAVDGVELEERAPVTVVDVATAVRPGCRCDSAGGMALVVVALPRPLWPRRRRAAAACASGKGVAPNLA